MQAKRFTDQQILAIIKEGESPDTTIASVCHKHGIADKTDYKWRKQYGGVEYASTLRELKALRTENERLKKIVAEKELDIQFLKSVNAKKR
jgi:putative transposase